MQGWSAVERSTGEAVATIVHVVDQGAYPMLEVEFDNGNLGFIPLPDHVKVEVKRENRQLVLDLPEGLLDVYLSNEDAQEQDDEFEWHEGS